VQFHKRPEFQHALSPTGTISCNISYLLGISIPHIWTDVKIGWDLNHEAKQVRPRRALLFIYQSSLSPQNAKTTNKSLKTVPIVRFRRRNKTRTARIME